MEYYAQPDKPAQAIFPDPASWYRGSVDSMGRDNYQDFQAAIHDPDTVIGMLGDYRAGIAVDHLHDREDREAGRKTSARSTNMVIEGRLGRPLRRPGCRVATLD
jgi:hypothetical protein